MNKSIELKSGQASILITDKGDIQLKGMNIKIDATQRADDQRAHHRRQGQDDAEGRGPGDARAQGRRPRPSCEASGITEVKGSLVKIN